MSDYGELVKQIRTEASHLGGIRWHRTAGLFTEAARAIESLLAEKASARDEALEEAASTAERVYAKDPFHFELGTAAAAAIRALRSPAKEKADG